MAQTPRQHRAPGSHHQLWRCIDRLERKNFRLERLSPENPCDPISAPTDTRSDHSDCYRKFSPAVVHINQRRYAVIEAGCIEAACDDRSSELFSCAGVSLPSVSRPRIDERVFSSLESFGRRPFYLRCVARQCVQFSFDFAATPFLLRRPRSSVVGFVPRSRGMYLDYGVYDVFRDLPDAADVALRLEAKGVWMLGFLVQMSERDVQRLGLAATPTLDAMKLHLSKIGMAFEMNIPWWNRDNRTFVSASRTAVRSCLPL